MLELRDVTKSYGADAAVDNVSFALAEAEFVTLLGPSGSGKSTILGMVAGYLKPDAGAIILDGRDVKGVSAAERGIGVVFQHYALFPHMTVEDNIAYGLKRRRWSARRARDRVEDMLSLTGLQGYGHRRPSQLSGGEQQRVALARALAFEPRVLLMDEPLGALDREIRVQMQEEIRRIHRELKPSILYVTHNKEEAFALSDRVGIMRKAKLVAYGSPSELYDTPTTAFVASFFAGRQILDVDILSIDAERGRASIRVSGVDFEAPLCAHHGVSPVVGRIAIPPAAVEVALPSANGSASATQPNRLVFSSHVEDIVYMGHSTQLHCVIEPGGQTIVAELRSQEAGRWVVGQHVQVSVDSSDTLVLSE